LKKQPWCITSLLYIALWKLMFLKNWKRNLRNLYSIVEMAN
jgi:hypothetical protein